MDEDVTVIGTRKPSRRPRMTSRLGADGRWRRCLTRVAQREHGQRIKRAIARQR